MPLQCDLNYREPRDDVGITLLRDTATTYRYERAQGTRLRIEFGDNTWSPENRRPTPTDGRIGRTGGRICGERTAAIR